MFCPLCLRCVPCVVVKWGHDHPDAMWYLASGKFQECPPLPSPTARLAKGLCTNVTLQDAKGQLQRDFRGGDEEREDGALCNLLHIGFPQIRQPK